MTQRYVILGASNVARSFPWLVYRLQQQAGEPCEVLAAIGHGRGYGRESRVLGIHRPSILDCGLWQALEGGGAGPLTALVTDIGNDLAYGVQPEELVAHVATCCQRLAGAERIVVMQLPLDGLARTSPLRFSLMRSVFFPRSTLTYAQGVARVRETNERLRALASEQPLQLIEPRAEWYGFDPIHIRRSQARAAWNWILTHVRGAAPSDKNVARDKNFSKLRRVVRRARPAVYRRFGRELRQAQPAVVWPDGHRLWLY